jgi:hypothetical protein
MFLLLLLKWLFCVALFLSPGYLISSWIFPCETNDKARHFAASVGISIAFISIIQLGCRFLLAPPLASQVVYGLGLLAALLQNLKLKKLAVKRPSPIFLAYLLFGFFCLLIMTLTASYEVASMWDWACYYPNIEIYQGQVSPKSASSDLAMEYLVRRTPNYSLVLSFLTQFPLSVNFADYQLASLAVNSTLIFGIFTLSDRLFGRKAAWAALLILPYAPMLLRYSYLCDPKFIAAFLALQSYAYYDRFLLTDDLQKRRSLAWLFALFSVTACMTHPAMLFYLLGLLIHRIFMAIKHKEKWHAELFKKVGISVLVFVVPWYTWLLIYFGNAVFKPTRTLDATAFPGFSSHLWNMTKMFYYSCFFQESLTSRLLHGFQPKSPGLIANWGHEIARFYWSTFLGCISLSGLSTVVIFGRSSSQKPPHSYVSTRRLLLGLALGVFLSFSAVFAADFKGQAGNLMAPCCILLLSWAGHRILSLSRKKIMLLISCLFVETMCIQILFFFVSASVPTQLKYQYNFHQVLPYERLKLVFFAIALLSTLGLYIWLVIKELKTDSQSC